MTYHTSLPHHPFRKALPTMSSIFQLLANEEKFTDELFAFITDGVGPNGGLSQGYLAGVIPDVNQKSRAADPRDGPRAAGQGGAEGS